MLEKYCANCNEVREILRVFGNVSCDSCWSSIRDCDCPAYCMECEKPFSVGA